MPKYKVILHQDVTEVHDGIEAESEEEAYEKAKDRSKPDSVTVFNESSEIEEIEER